MLTSKSFSIAALEECLSQKQNGEGCLDLEDEKTEADEEPIEDQIHQPGSVHSVDVESSPQNSFQEIKAFESSVGLREACIPDLMQAELYVLYTDFHADVKSEKQE